MIFTKKRDEPRRERRRPADRDMSRQPARPTTSGAPSQTFSYYASRSSNDTNIGRAAQATQPVRRRPSKFRRILRSHKRMAIGSIVLVGLFIFSIQLTADPKVVPLTTDANAPFLHMTSRYQQKAAALFAASAANRNKLTVNAAAIAGQLKTAFPELRDVSVALPLLGHQPTVYIQPSSPAAVLATSSGRFVIDETGRALIKVKAANDVSRYNVPTVTDQSGLRVTLGQAVLPRSTARFMHTIIEQLDAKHVKIERITLPQAASELDVYIAGKPYFVKFNLHDDEPSAAVVQVGTYLATAKYLAAHGKTPGQYIDARLGGRVYYK